MIKKFTHPLILAVALLGAISLSAQSAEKKDAPQKAKKASPLPGAGTGGTTPHATTGAVIDGNRVTLVYGRPFMKHPRTGKLRTTWGGDLVPAGKVWRTGADEATLLITQKPIELGGATIPAGAHTLWTLLNEDGTAKLIVNKQIGQWGADRDLKNIYDEANDVVRADMKKETVSPTVEQFTMAVERAPGGGVLKMTWDTTQYSVPFKVKK